MRRAGPGGRRARRCGRAGRSATAGLLEGVDDQVLLAGPAAVQGRLAGVGAGGHPPPSSGRRSRPPGAGRGRVVDGALQGLGRGAGSGRAAAHRAEPSWSPLERPWSDLPKRILRILVNACVLNLAGVPSHELRTPSYTTEEDGTAHDSPAVDETASARRGAARAPSRAGPHHHRGLPAHGGAGRDHREHRPAPDPTGPRLLHHQPVVGPERLHPHLRRPPAAGGRAGDILGRRRTFIAGILVFTLASFLGGLATSSAGCWPPAPSRGSAPPSPRPRRCR